MGSYPCANELGLYIKRGETKLKRTDRNLMILHDASKCRDDVVEVHPVPLRSRHCFGGILSDETQGFGTLRVLLIGEPYGFESGDDVVRCFAGERTDVALQSSR